MWPDGFEFHHPWVLLLALPALVLVAWQRRKRFSPAIVFPTVARLRGLRPTLRQRAQFLIPLLQALAIIGFLGAAARPRLGEEHTVVKSQGIAIQMVVDRSSTMQKPMRHRSRERPRIEILKDVFARFVSGGEGLEGRTTDLIGLTTFARYTEENCPLVSQHEPLVTAVANLRTVAPALNRYDQPLTLEQLREHQARRSHVKANPLDGTAIGDAIYRAVLSLVSAEEDLAAVAEDSEDADDSTTGYEINGKVIILLTDGQNNAGMDPVEAARYAAENDIRIYYIVFHDLVEYVPTITGRQVKRELDRDEVLAVPREIAQLTKGRAFVAGSGDELRSVYEEINTLEKSEIGTIEFLSYEEKFRFFLLPALGCAIAALVLGETLLRRSP